MRLVALLILLYPFSAIASAQTAEKCPPSGRAGDLLNCYNGIAPPPALGKSSLGKSSLGKSRRPRASTATDTTAAIKEPIADGKPMSKGSADGRAPYVDMLDVENKQLGERLKTLCRGC
jgi:hypothetical protein